MKRFYLEIIRQHFQKHRQMLFLMGPRQVGKTTLIKEYARLTKNSHYFNWDNQDHRSVILKGPQAIINEMHLDVLGTSKKVLLFDELQKYNEWKNFLKGIYDTYGEMLDIIVTGSARLDIFQKGGDSLMGRYFPYYIHPITVGEIVNQKTDNDQLTAPKKISEMQYKRLITFGGFPDPFIKKDARFFNRWKLLRKKQLIEEEIRDLTKIQDLDRIEILAELIKSQVGQLVNYSSLSQKIRVSDNSIRSWLSALTNLCYCFPIFPWSKNVAKSLVKNPKYYLWDWALCSDSGQKLENFVASHLLKATHFWTNDGFGEYSLHFLRDKCKREVDFLIVKDKIPWCLIEVKTSSKSLSEALYYYHDILKPKYTFQIVENMPFINQNCFKSKKPSIIPLKTFLSQLV